MRAVAVSQPGSDAPNEDWAGVLPGAAVVLDGVTVMDGMEPGCFHGTSWYVRQLGTAFLSALALDEPPFVVDPLGEAPSMIEALRYAINQTAFLHSQTCDLDAPGAPSAAVAAVRMRGEWLEYLVLADVTVALGLHGFKYQVITDGRVEVSVAGLHSRTPGVDARVAEARALARNVEGGYWVAAADPGAANHAVTGMVPLADVNTAALLTDGAARLADMFQAPWEEVLYKDPRQVLLEVRTIERSDPECARWPRFKMSDDATMVSFGSEAP